MNKVSNQDADFINHFVFSKFFKADTFMIILDILGNEQFALDPNTQIFNLLYQHLNLLHSVDKDNFGLLSALRVTKCHIYA